jgi:tripartite-type tricarboxylate transporter receptor subunit TctC
MKLLRCLVAAVAAVAVPTGASAQGYPSKVVRIVSSYAAGGPNDVFARVIAQKLQERLGQTVIVENRAGADGRIGAGSVAKAEPDGHTLLMLALAHTAHVNLYKLPYDVEKDFAPIAQVASVPLILVVGKDVKAKTAGELIALAKANPDGLNYASGGRGTSQHLAMEMFSSKAGIKLRHIPYKGLPGALTDILNGEVQAMMSPIAFALQNVKTGDLRVLGITSAARSPLVPDVPTLAEAGIPNCIIDTWHGLVAPAGTPAAIITRLNAEMVAILGQQDVRDHFATLGAVPVGNSPSEFARQISAEIAAWGKVIKEADIKVD